MRNKGFIIIELLVILTLAAALAITQAHKAKSEAYVDYCEVADFICPQNADSLPTQRRLSDYNFKVAHICNRQLICRLVGVKEPVQQSVAKSPKSSHPHSTAGQ